MICCAGISVFCITNRWRKAEVDEKLFSTFKKTLGIVIINMLSSANIILQRGGIWNLAQTQMWCFIVKFQVSPLRRRMFVINTTISVVFKPNTMDKSWCLSQTPQFFQTPHFLVNFGLIKFWSFESLIWIGRGVKLESLSRSLYYQVLEARLWLHCQFC